MYIHFRYACGIFSNMINFKFVADTFCWSSFHLLPLPLQGVGGTVQHPKTYLKQVYAMVRERGGLCVSDEVRMEGEGGPGSQSTLHFCRSRQVLVVLALTTGALRPME